MPIHLSFGVIAFKTAIRCIGSQHGIWRINTIGGKFSAATKSKKPNRIEPDSILRIPIKLLKQAPASATIAFVAGAVDHRPAGASSNQPLKQGASVRQGDEILTGANGTATVDFLDGSQLVILRNTVVGFATLKGRRDTGVTSIQIDLKQGRVETRVTPRKRGASRYEIVTPTVQIGVRGTEFRVKLDDSNELTRTEVLHGQVAAKNPFGSQSVPKGFGTLTEKNKAPLPPIPLLPAPTVPSLLVTPNSISAHWPPLANALSYRIVIATDSGFAKRVAEYVSTKPEIQLAPLPTGHYYLRALGVDTQGLEGNAGERTIDF